MKRRIFKYLSKIDNWLYIILTFCFFGCIRNLLMLKYFGFNYSAFITKACVAMLVIYFAQSVLILLRQRSVWVISFVQCFFCLFVYKDFTFLPLTNLFKLIKNLFFTDLTYGGEYFFSFTVLSFLFCAEIIKTYLLYALTDQYNLRKKNENTKI